MPQSTAIPTLTRRTLLQAGSAVLAGFDLAPLARPLQAAASSAKPRGTADACVFVFLGGGISHVDSFDLKEGDWTPQDFDIREVAPGVKMPVALFPKLSKEVNRFSILRSMEAWETEHGRASYYLHTVHPPSPARLAEIPSIGAVAAYEFRDKRKSTDVLPPFVSLNYGPDQVRQGFLEPRFSPLNLFTNRGFDFIIPDAEQGRFKRRVEQLKQLEELSGHGWEQERLVESFRSDSLTMMNAAGMRDVLAMPEDERKRYGASKFCDACLLVRNILAAGRGTRFLSINDGGWDFHTNIYDKTQKSNQYTKSLELDAGLAALLGDLDRTKLLERTLIVVLGEFGRTIGKLTVGKGRDHHRFAMSGLFAGGGVKGGQTIGATDALGERVTAPGWARKRSIYPEDVAATIYSALGIDWTKKMTNTPSGRFFQYVEPLSGTSVFEPSEVGELFG